MHIFPGHLLHPRTRDSNSFHVNLAREKCQDRCNTDNLRLTGMSHHRIISDSNNVELMVDM
jgi:hypothetical protein